MFCKITSALFLLLISFLLSSCAGMTHSREPVSPGFLYESKFLNVRAPNSEGWFVVTSPSGREFARSGKEENETFAGQVLFFPLKETGSKAELVSQIKKAFEDGDTGRYEKIESQFKYSSQRKYPCVSVEKVDKDKKFNSYLLQTKGLYCRHPVSKNAGFAIVFSHRGASLYPNFKAEAKSFIKGVQVSGY